MIYRIAIVDDDQTFAAKLKGSINKFCSKRNLMHEIETYTDGDEITEMYRSQYDLLFLDIQMKRLDGMSTAKFIRKFDNEAVIIFLTNMPQFAIEGYTVDALDYVLKPLEEDRLEKSLLKAFKHIDENKKDKSMVFRTGNGMVKKSVTDIVFIESDKHLMSVHTIDGETFTIWSTLSALEKSLAADNFVRCSKFCIVNLAYVTGIKAGYIQLATKESVLLGGAMKKSFIEELFRYSRSAIEPDGGV